MFHPCPGPGELPVAEFILLGELPAPHAATVDLLLGMGSAFGDGFALSEIGGISPDGLFLAMKQIADAVGIVDVGRCGDQTVDRSRLGIDTDMCLHAEVPLVALSCLVHLRVPGFGFVFGRRGGGDDGGIHDGSFGHPQPLGLEVQGNGFEQLLPQVVGLEEMTELADRSLVRHRFVPRSIPANRRMDSMS